MDGYLTTKLRNLSISRSAIEDLSCWIIRQCENYNEVVQTWLDELRMAKEHQMLPFLYLTNDVIQNSKRLGNGYIQAFEKVLTEALQQIAMDGNVLSREKVLTLLAVWKIRGVYEPELVTVFEDTYSKWWNQFHGKIINEGDCKQKDVIVGKKDKSGPDLDKPYEPEDDGTDLGTGSGVDDFDKMNFSAIDREMIRKIVIAEEGNTTGEGSGKEKCSRQELMEVKLNPGLLNRSLAQEEIIKAIERLGMLPTADITTRALISQFPSQLSDGNLAMSLCKNLESTLRLSVDLANANIILADYNRRLDLENDIRIDGTYKLQMFTTLEREKLYLAEQLLQEQKRAESELNVKLITLKQYLGNLPLESTCLPDLIEGLNPLPSAQDLFQK